MDIRGVNGLQQSFYSNPIRQSRSVETQSNVAQDNLQARERSVKLLEGPKELTAVSQLDDKEKSYFSNAFQQNAIVQQYLGNGDLRNFTPKGQFVDLKG